MTQIQETYNKYITSKSICQGCRKEVSFQSVVDWGYEVNSFKCPYCRVLVPITNTEALDAAKRMGHLDKALVKRLLEHAKQGQLHDHEVADTTQWACLCMVNNMVSVYAPGNSPVPLSYIHRMFLVQLYRQLVEGGKMPAIDMYAIQAPIPVELVQPKIGTLTHQIQSARGGGEEKEEKEKEGYRYIGYVYDRSGSTEKEKEKKEEKEDRGRKGF